MLRLMLYRQNTRNLRRWGGAVLSLALVLGLTLAASAWLAGGTRASAAQKIKRTYYIAADEVAWDYAPTGINQITGAPFGERENVFVGNGPDRIGRVYIKALYREYTDASFTTLKPPPAQWQHLGTLGPLIRAQVGDSIRVVFKNKTRFSTSFHVHGLFYRKDSEGAPYNDGTARTDKADDVVPPDRSHTYTYEVPKRAGPGPNDPSSILWLYHSHVDETADSNAGLIGPIIVTRRGQARPDGSPKDLDREFVTMFTVFDENVSPYLDLNIETYAGDPASVDPEDEDFQESNLMHSINGYVYGNLPLLTTPRGERVRWYLIGMGTEVDLHTPHWHGNTVLENGNRRDTVELLPASLKVADMVPDNVGTWLYHCHVNDHIDAGMLGRFRVTQ
jgi:FtsP/CotA-like multicopper oxidase with cupredoxin domain